MWMKWRTARGSAWRCNRRTDATAETDWGQIWNAANFRGLDGLPLQFRGYGPKFLEELIDALGRKSFAFRGL